MVLVNIKYVGIKTPPHTEPIYWGRSIDEPLKPDFPISQPAKIIAITYGSFSLEEFRDLKEGNHYVEFNCSVPSAVGCSGEIWVEGNLVASGSLGSDKAPLKAYITVGAKGVERASTTPPALGASVAALLGVGVLAGLAYVFFQFSV